MKLLTTYEAKNAAGKFSAMIRRARRYPRTVARQRTPSAAMRRVFGP